MTYQTRRFEFQTGQAGRGNYVADRINQFLSLNPTLTPVDLSITWRDGRSRSDTFYLTLTYRNSMGPGRLWAISFSSTSSTPAEDQATGFFTANPTFLPVQTVVITPPGAVSTSRKLLILYGNRANTPTLAHPQIIPGSALALIAPGAYGTLYDNLDFTRAPMMALNLGNSNWPAGGTNLLFSSLDNYPDISAYAGVGPVCYAGAIFTSPPPYTIALLCGACFDPSVVTVTYTTISTTTTTGTTTTTTTTTTTSTTTTTTTTTTSTTTTTTTAPPTTTTTTAPPTTTTTTSSCTSYTFSNSGSGAGTATHTLPGGACGGTISGTVAFDANAGASQGLTICISINGGAPSCTGCLNSGGFSLFIPPATSTVAVTITTGCNGGAVVNTWSYTVHG